MLDEILYIRVKKSIDDLIENFIGYDELEKLFELNGSLLEFTDTELSAVGGFFGEIRDIHTFIELFEVDVELIELAVAAEYLNLGSLLGEEDDYVDDGFFIVAVDFLEALDFDLVLRWFFLGSDNLGFIVGGIGSIFSKSGILGLNSLATEVNLVGLRILGV